ncbi:hypothetical protein AJ88_00685 [Mesorhizobium amorphae CCBAU 01583]|nr:hypothetical protein AJ88_00685 [Mesorhizobium amorphae CCBAU 01583]
MAGRSAKGSSDGVPAALRPEIAAETFWPRGTSEDHPLMMVLLTPSYCSRFGIAVLLVALADFLFYGQPAGINFLLFAILIAGAIVAVHPSAFSDARLWLKPVALLVALLPLVENDSPLSVSIALVALAVFALSLPDGCVPALPASPASSASSSSPPRSDWSATSSAGARRRGGLGGGASGWRPSPSG